MAGPGRTPKPRHMLSRPSKRKAKDLEYDGPVIDGTPELRHPTDDDWHSNTLAWWAAIWTGPAASEYVPSDVDGLLRLAMLVDAFWQEPSTKLSAEIRLQEARFGLDPIARRRLQLEVRRVEGEKPKPAKPERDRKDPRLTLGQLKVLK